MLTHLIWLVIHRRFHHNHFCNHYAIYQIKTETSEENSNCTRKNLFGSNEKNQKNKHKLKHKHIYKLNTKQSEKKHYSNLPEGLRDHTLLIAFAPVEQPEVAIAVLVENDSVASFVARKVMDAYFELKTP